MKVLNIAKVTSVPTGFLANTQYFIPVPGEPNLVDVYVSDNTGGTARHIITKAEINTMINTAVAGLTGGAVVVADITARNALAPTKVTMAYVLNATGDSTVTSGAATYLYNPANSTWSKISEAESLDVIVQYANIQGKPNVTNTAIETAVANSHTHTNKAILDSLTTVGSALYYQNEPVNGNIISEQW